MSDTHAAIISWAFMVFVWIPMLVYLIDRTGVIMGWWTDETFWGVPK